MNNFKKALVASVAAGIVVAGAGAPAFAQEGAAAGGLDLSTIQQLVKADAKTNLIIHKHAGPSDSSDSVSDGLVKDNVQHDPVEGAEFTIWQVAGIDLTTQAGWEQAQKLQDAKADVDPAESGWTEVAKAVTDADGTISFGDLPVGLFYVKETAGAEGYAPDAAPFFVALPKTDPSTRDKRLETVHVYAKNTQQTEVTKTVEDANQNASEQTSDDGIAKFTISAGINAGNDLKKFAVGDAYPSKRLDFIEDSITVSLAKDVADAEGNINTEEETIDPALYTVENDPEKNGEVGMTTVAFTEEGLDLLAQNKGAKVLVHLNYKLIPVEANEDGSVDEFWNSFDVRTQVGNQVDPGNPGEDYVPGNPPSTPDGGTPENPTPATHSYFGNVQVKKMKSGDVPEGGSEEDLLIKDGVAKFDLYRCDGSEDKATLLEEAPLQTGIETQGGVATITGLHVNDYVDGKAQASNPSGYCLIETQSPNGYELLAEPRYFQVLKGDATDKIQLTSLNVTNVDKNAGFDLPLTGGNGIYWLLIAGGVLVLAGGSAYYIQRRNA